MTNGKQAQSKKILIVEDEATLRTPLKDKLTQSGYTVIIATNGQEGLSEAILQHPDLILLDLFMPVVDGTRMLENLRLDEWGKQVPVIVLTNIGSADVEAQVRKYDISAFIIKSNIDPADIIKKIDSVLS